MKSLASLISLMLIITGLGWYLFSDRQQQADSDAFSRGSGAGTERQSVAQQRSSDLPVIPTQTAAVGESPASSLSAETSESVTSASNRLEQSATRDNSEQAAQNSSTLDENATLDEDTELESAPTLSLPVFDVINAVQSLQMAGEWPQALNAMNTLYAGYDELNALEQATLLSFYTNTLLALGMNAEAMTAFEQLLVIPDLRPDLHARSLMALGQLYARAEGYQVSILYLTDWLALTESMETRPGSTESALLMVANNYYALQEYSQAVPPLERHIAMLMAEGKAIPAATTALHTSLLTATGESTGH